MGAGRPLHARAGELELRFSEPLDPRSVTPDAFALSRWSYRDSGQYGSADWSVADPTRGGRDALAVQAATLGAGGRTVLLAVPALAPVMQQELSWSLRAAGGAAVEGVLYHTLHSLPAR